jgi:hypothetical protein
MATTFVGVRGDVDLREEYAFAEGLRAYAAGFSWLALSTLRYLWTNVPLDPAHVPYAALNRFWHSRRAADPRLTAGAQPNDDTPYSIAWLDLTTEPIVISHRDMGARYFAFDVIGMDLERVASIASRVTGPAAGAFAICGPDWRGRLPVGVVPLPRARSNSVLVVGRTESRGPADLAAVREAQNGYRLIPASRWPDSPLPPESRAVIEPILPAHDLLGDWKTMNVALTADPPRGTAGAGWAHLGIGPGLHVEAQPESTRRGLARAAAYARVHFAPRGRSLGGASSGKRGQWRLLASPSDDLAVGSPSIAWQIAASGAAGRRRIGRRAARAWSEGDPVGEALWGRAGLELVAGLACDPGHAPVEFAVARDAHGAPLVGGRAYRLRFAPGCLPPARYAWAVTLYSSDGSLAVDARGPATVGSRHASFRLDPDGGATLRIAPSAPSGGGPWLAAPQAARAYYLVLRLYAGDRQAIVSAWSPPPIEPDGDSPPSSGEVTRIG